MTGLWGIRRRRSDESSGSRRTGQLTGANKLGTGMWESYNV